MARITPDTFDYSDRDFESLKARLQGLARSVFPDWTDFNVANFGNILVELFSFVGDVLNFYQDNQAGEAFIPTLTHRISMIRLGQLIGFSMSGASAATTTETFTIPLAYGYALSIPRGTKLRSSDPERPVSFQTVLASSISVGATTANVSVEQSERRTETFNSTDEPNQELVLSNTPFLDRSMDTCAWDGQTLLYGMTAINGDYYRVDSFLGYGATDRVFVTVTDQMDRCHVYFGNGANGAIPQGEIRASYKIGGGQTGNVEAGRISILESNLFYADGISATVTVTNAAAASGGADRMSLNEAALLAPASLRTLTRTVTKQDYEDVALSLRGVARALMATSNEYPGITENTGKLYIVAQGARLASGRLAPALPDTAMLTNVKDYIDLYRPSTITFTYETLAAVFKDITVQTKVYLRYGADPETVGEAIRNALDDFFAVTLEDGSANQLVDFGANIRDANNVIVREVVWSDVHDCIRDADGVRKVDEGSDGLLLGVYGTGTGNRQSMRLLPVEFPRLRSVVVINGDTGSTI